MLIYNGFWRTIQTGIRVPGVSRVRADQPIKAAGSAGQDNGQQDNRQIVNRQALNEEEMASPFAGDGLYA
jgi:hypothetical protein